MKRWHLTVFLALLAAGGVALAVSLPVVGLGIGHALAPAPVVVVEPMPVEVQAIPVAPVVVEPVVVAPLPPPPIAPIEVPPPPRPNLPQRPVDDGVHPIHTDQGQGGGGIPELTEPRPVRPIVTPPVIHQLPPDPVPFIDNCPACGMG